jgi:hypothetical protein
LLIFLSLFKDIFGSEIIELKPPEASSKHEVQVDYDHEEYHEDG